MLSQKCKYALRAILYLAVEGSEVDKKIGGKKLAEALKIPAPYLGKILQTLVPQGIISSVKGPSGGFYLTAENKKVRLISVIEVVDGLGFFDECGLGLTECSDSHPCPMHNEFKKMRHHFKQSFANKTIHQLATDIVTKEFILVR